MDKLCGRVSGEAVLEAVLGGCVERLKGDIGRQCRGCCVGR